MDGLTTFGPLAVALMLVAYALEGRRAWPFGLVEGVWAVVALAKWRGLANSSS